MLPALHHAERDGRNRDHRGCKTDPAQAAALAR